MTKDQFANAEKLIDIELTDAERDSLLSQAQNYLLTYKAMHKQKIENSLAPALFFDPSVGMSDVGFRTAAGKPTSEIKNLKSVWAVPKQLEMPKNKADLAFFTLPQLASLIQRDRKSVV